MAFEHKENSGSLFKNERKTTDKHPDYTGSGLIEGVDMWISAWVKPAKEGKKPFMSLAFSRKDGAKSKDSFSSNQPGVIPAKADGDMPF
jgi:hypothetical protein